MAQESDFDQKVKSFIESQNGWFIHEGSTTAKTDEIVAWMPLPKPYKAGE